MQKPNIILRIKGKVLEEEEEEKKNKNNFLKNSLKN